MMKDVFMTVIKKGGYDLPTMLDRIDEYHIAGKLSDGDRDELQAAARGDAAPILDIEKEIQRLWSEIRELEAEIAKLKGEVDTDVPDDGIAEYAQPTGAHDAYFAGDFVTYNGVVYECVAPEGVACVWAPDVMPTYWRAN